VVNAGDVAGGGTLVSIMGTFVFDWECGGIVVVGGGGGDDDMSIF
jgi:hypothetical protein